MLVHSSPISSRPKAGSWSNITLCYTCQPYPWCQGHRLPDTHTQNGGAHGCVFATFKHKSLQTMLLIHSFFKTPVASLFFKLFLSKGSMMLLCSLSPLTLSCPCRAAVLAAIKSQNFMESLFPEVSATVNRTDLRLSVRSLFPEVSTTVNRTYLGLGIMSPVFRGEYQCKQDLP